MSQPPPVTLRDVKDSDIPIFYQQNLDPEANHMAAFTSQDPTDRYQFDAHWLRIRRETGVLIRTIVTEGQVAGYVLSYLSELGPEVSYWLGKDFWGKGVASAALVAFLDVQRVRPIFGRVAKDNAGSRRVMEKCGFEVIREERDFANARGEEIDELVLKLG